MKSTTFQVSCSDTIVFQAGMPVSRHFAEGKMERMSNRSGALATREQPDHAGCLHTGSELEQAGSTEQGCEDDGSKSG
jgi:hypothetical protein